MRTDERRNHPNAQEVLGNGIDQDCDNHDATNRKLQFGAFTTSSWARTGAVSHNFDGVKVGNGVAAGTVTYTTAHTIHRGKVHATVEDAEPQVLTATPDLDGDGVLDPWWDPGNYALGTSEPAELTCWIPSRFLPTSGRHFDFEPQWCVNTTSGKQADLDGDGLPETMLYIHGASYPDLYEGRGRVAVLPGVEIPWDDPTKW